MLQKINYTLKYINIENSELIVVHNITVLLYFYQINAVLLRIRDFFQKHKSYTLP